MELADRIATNSPVAVDVTKRIIAEGGAASRLGSGRGLAGLRRRVTALGGSLTAGPADPAALAFGAAQELGQAVVALGADHHVDNRRAPDDLPSLRLGDAAGDDHLGVPAPLGPLALQDLDATELGVLAECSGDLREIVDVLELRRRNGGLSAHSMIVVGASTAPSRSSPAPRRAMAARDCWLCQWVRNSTATHPSVSNARSSVATSGRSTATSPAEEPCSQMQEGKRSPRPKPKRSAKSRRPDVHNRYKIHGERRTSATR